MIDVERLGKVYGDTQALADVTFRASPGEIVGLLGPNGAGKSTTVKILTGMIKPSSGRASVAGYDVVAQPLEVKRRIGYVPETGALYETLTGDEQLEFVAALHHLDARSAEARAAELLALFDLESVRHRRLSELSKGMKQKVLIASALLHNPEVLCFDEPLNGLDANAALVMKQVLRGLAAQRRTVLFCSHTMEVVERICTRILLIDHGRLVADGTPVDLVAQAGGTSLEEAFHRLTGASPAERVAADVIAALER